MRKESVYLGIRIERAVSKTGASLINRNFAADPKATAKRVDQSVGSHGLPGIKSLSEKDPLAWKAF